MGAHGFFDSEDQLEMSVNGVSVNDQMPVFAFDRLIQLIGDLNEKNVAFLGVSYRGDVGDTRFTPVEKLVELVQKAGAKILLHDPFVSFWEERNVFVEDDLDAVFYHNPDIIIISSGHSYYKKHETIDRLMKVNHAFIYDTLGLFSGRQLAYLRSKHKVSVLGRGDVD